MDPIEFIVVSDDDMETPQRVSAQRKLFHSLKRHTAEYDLFNLSPEMQQIYLELTKAKKKKLEERITAPIEPHLATSLRSELRREVIMSGEELALIETERKQDELKKMIKHNTEHYKKALEGQVKEIKSTKPPTRHIEVHLRTAERVEAYQRFIREVEEKRKSNEKEKVKERHVTPVVIMKLTKPEPFNFASERRVHGQEVREEFVSLQEQVNSFYLRKESPEKISSSKKTITYPKSPNFELDKRLVHVSNMKSTEEMELEEIANYPKFKARPVDPKLLYEEPVVYIESKPPTTFKEFNLQTELRNNHKEVNTENSVEERTIKTTKLNPRILEAPDFVPVKNTLPTTTPQPFTFLTEKRNSFHKEENTEEIIKEFKALPVPKYPAKPFEELSKHKPTEIAEFNLSQSRSKSVEQAPQEQFKARPMPNYKSIPEMKFESKVTKPVEFKFITDQRLRSDKTVSVEPGTFKALEMPDFSKIKPPVQSHNKSPTKAEGMKLETEKRALTRAEFDKEKIKAEELAIQEKKLKEFEDLKKSEAEIKELRKSMTFKAREIMKGNPIEIKPSTIPLTIPRAPLLNTNKRAIKSKTTDISFNSCKD